MIEFQICVDTIVDKINQKILMLKPPSFKLAKRKPYTFAKKPLIMTDHKEQTKMTLFLLKTRPFNTENFSNQSSEIERRIPEADLVL